MIADQRASAGQTSVIVGGSWQFEPSMNFYRIKNKWDWMQPVERRRPDAPADYYVFLAEHAGLAESLGLRRLFQDPFGGSVLAKKQ